MATARRWASSSSSTATSMRAARTPARCRSGLPRSRRRRNRTVIADREKGRLRPPLFVCPPVGSARRNKQYNFGVDAPREGGNPLRTPIFWRRTAEGIHADALDLDTRGLGYGEHHVGADAGRARQVSRQHHHDLPELPYAERRARRADL